MSSPGAAPRAAVPASPARAAASRTNGARSRGPKTAAGKARAAQNALKHGLRANTYVVLLDEDWGEFAALERALLAELAPAGAVQRIIASRIARASWRLMRAERLEVELFNTYSAPTGGLARALIRDGHGTRSFATVQRYRAAALAELTRCLRTLTTLQAEARAAAAIAAPPRPRAAPPRARAITRPPQRTPSATRTEPAEPNEPERRAPAATPNPPAAPNHPAMRAHPSRPRDRTNPSAAPRVERGKPRAHRAPAAAAARRAHAQHAADRTRGSAGDNVAASAYRAGSPSRSIAPIASSART